MPSQHISECRVRRGMKRLSSVTLYTPLMLTCSEMFRYIRLVKFSNLIICRQRQVAAYEARILRHFKFGRRFIFFEIKPFRLFESLLAKLLQTAEREKVFVDSTVNI